MAHKHLKSNIDLINDCDQSPPSPQLLYSFKLAGLPGTYGHLLQETARSITWEEDRWKVDHDSREIRLLGKSERERTQWLRETLLQEKRKGTFHLLSLWTGESCPVYGPTGEIVLSIERIAAPLFGVVTYGAGADQAHVPRNARQHRRGSLTTGETPFECLVREANEEALFDTALTKSTATAVGAISYLCLTDERSKGEKGLLCPEIQLTYEMKIPADMVPVPGDGEAEGFALMQSISSRRHSPMASSHRLMGRWFSISSSVVAS
ncbi:Uncharacterized protein LA080_013661 [Diaporthe eres]|nr:Uncharacterized protein LA080_013661 [Diaporthe eres]